MLGLGIIQISSGPAMIISELAAWALNAAIVPLEPTEASHRLGWVVEDARPKVIIVDGHDAMCRLQSMLAEGGLHNMSEEVQSSMAISDLQNYLLPRQSMHTELDMHSHAYVPCQAPAISKLSPRAVFQGLYNFNHLGGVAALRTPCSVDPQDVAAVNVPRVLHFGQRAVDSRATFSRIRMALALTFSSRDEH